MSSHSNIEWTDATWNPIVGCTIVSPGCTHCYAMRDAWRKNFNTSTPHYHGLTKQVNGNAVWTGNVAIAPDSIFLAPLKWRKPKRIFVNSMGDLFHKDIPNEALARAFYVMAQTPHHTYQVLTKRADRAREILSDNEFAGDIATTLRIIDDPDNPPFRWPLPNVWLGVSAERQQEADERIPDLLAAPAAVRFVSCEPLLGAINLRRIKSTGFCDPFNRPYVDALSGETVAENGEQGPLLVANSQPRIRWVIVGGESGPNARPMNPDWARSLRDQCQAAEVAFHFKQWGEWAPKTNRDGWKLSKDHIVFSEGDSPQLYKGWPPGGGANAPPAFLERVGKKAAGRLLDGHTHDQFPEAST